MPCAHKKQPHSEAARKALYKRVRSKGVRKGTKKNKSLADTIKGYM